MAPSRQRLKTALLERLVKPYAQRHVQRHVKVYADKLRDWQYAGVLGVLHRIARRGVESSSRLGRHRWKVERSLAWLLATGV
jgi:hypothetical protein